MEKHSTTLIDNASKVLNTLYIYPDGAQVKELEAILGISYRKVIAYLVFLRKHGFVTHAREEEGVIWYPVYTIEELKEMGA